MSSRALRRMQEGSVAQGLPCGQLSSNDESDKEEVTKKTPKKQPKGNLFDLVRSFFFMKYFVV